MPPNARLRRRVGYFFASEAHSRREVAEFADLLLALGPTAVIGGCIRDLHLAGNRRFRSDVDFVVDPASMPAFERLVGRLGGTANRFGGWGIGLGRWKADVWALERTWAAAAGHVTVSSLDDLLGTTFFDWDAILYSLADRRLTEDGAWFDRIRRRVIDINLAPNPNPLGNAVRALRYACRWEAALGERLAAHVCGQIRDHGWDAIAARERSAFPVQFLAGVDGGAVARTLLAHGRSGGTVRLPLKPSPNPLRQLRARSPESRGVFI